MNEKVEEIDSGRMEILAEFSGPGNGGDEMIPYRIGVWKNDFIIASQSSIAQKPQGKSVPENVDERTRAVFEDGIRRDWWSGDIIFSLDNYAAVLARLEEVFDVRPAREIDLNDFEIKGSGDTMGVRMNAISPHNAALPVITVQLTNYREANIDGVAKNEWHVYLSPETGEKLMEEMRRIQPAIGRR